MRLRIPILLYFVIAIAFFSSCSLQNQGFEENPITKVSDLANKKVGVQIGNTADIYASEYDSENGRINVERYTKLSDAVQALKQGKIDAVLLDDQPAAYFVKQNPVLKILDEAFVEESYKIRGRFSTSMAGSGADHNKKSNNDYTTYLGEVREQTREK